jgi:hypothetical protein
MSQESQNAAGRAADKQLTAKWAKVTEKVWRETSKDLHPLLFPPFTHNHPRLAKISPAHVRQEWRLTTKHTRKIRLCCGLANPEIDLEIALTVEKITRWISTWCCWKGVKSLDLIFTSRIEDCSLSFPACRRNSRVVLGTLPNENSAYRACTRREHGKTYVAKSEFRQSDCFVNQYWSELRFGQLHQDHTQRRHYPALMSLDSFV